MDIFQLAGTISVKYSDAVDGLEKVSKSADEAAEGLKGVDDSASKTDDSVKGVGSSTQKTNGDFTVWKATLANLAAQAITAVISKCAELASTVVGLGTDFTAAMSEVQAISGATDEQMAQLEATAREFGSTTVFSATDAAEALKYMSLAGWSVEQSTSALGGVLDLAAASGMDLAEASDMVTDYLSAFGMEANQSAYFADMLAYAQAHSNTTTAQLGEAFKNCAATMNAAGQDVETTTSLLEGLANQGLKGSEAGTAVTAMMRDITNAMEDGQISIGETSIAVTDAGGNFRDLTDILTDVEAATNGMGSAERAAALASVFTADSTKGLNLILNEGMDSIAGYEEELRNANGTAKEMADTMNDNLAGDVKNAQSAFEELGLKIFDKFEQPMRTAVQFVTGSVVPAFEWMINNLPTVGAALGTVMAVVTAAKWTSVTSGITGFVGALGSIITAVNPVVLVIGLAVTAIVYLWNNCEGFRNAATAIWNGILSVISSVVSGIVTFFTVTVPGALNSLAAFFSGVWNGITSVVSSAWNTICNVVQVAIMLLGEIINAAVQIITIPFQFIWQNCQEVITSAWESIKTVVTAAMDAISSTISSAWSGIAAFIVSVLNGIRNTFSGVWNAISSIVSGVVNAIGNVISSVFNSVKNTVTNVLNSIKTTFSTVWNGVKNTVTNAVNGVKSTISSGLNSAKSTVSSVLDGIKNKFKSVWDNAKNTVSNAINKIKSVMNFSWSLPHLKLPHFNISGSFSLNPPSVPHFSVSWYKKAMLEGMIMNSPTIFGFNAKTNQLMAGGEAGSETVVGTESLMSMIQTAVGTENAAMLEVLNLILRAIYSLDDTLGEKLYKALLGLKFQINEREFARLVKAV